MALLTHNGKVAADQPPRTSGHGRRRGFTFIELMVVLTIIVVLVTMAIPIYQKSIIRAKESVLKNNLFTIRTVSIISDSTSRAEVPGSVESW